MEGRGKRKERKASNACKRGRGDWVDTFSKASFTGIKILSHSWLLRISNLDCKPEYVRVCEYERVPTGSGARLLERVLACE